MKTLYAVTHVNEDGIRQLSYANQGRNHSETKEEAERKLVPFISNNSESQLSSAFGKQALGTFEVRPVECYDHGDAVRIYFES